MAAPRPKIQDGIFVNCLRTVLSSSNSTEVMTEPNINPKVPSLRFTAKIPPTLLARINIDPTERSVTPVVNTKHIHHAKNMAVTELVKTEDKFYTVRSFPDVTIFKIM